MKVTTSHSAIAIAIALFMTQTVATTYTSPTTPIMANTTDSFLQPTAAPMASPVWDFDPTSKFLEIWG